LGKADIERTRYYPQSQLHTKQTPGIRPWVFLSKHGIRNYSR